MSSETKDETIWISSFDIGKRNFAFYIQEVNISNLKNIVNVKDRYNVDGTCKPEMKSILEKVYKNGKTILHKNLDLTYNCDPKAYLDPETYNNMVDVLEEHNEYFDQCSVFLVEEQMNFGRKKRNPMAVKLGQHCYSYFCIRYGRFKEVLYFPAYHKTQVLGAEKVKGNAYKNGNFRWKSMDKPARKKWAVRKAYEVLELRGEEDVIDNITLKGKKDDLADTLLMCSAFMYLRYIAKEI